MNTIEKLQQDVDLDRLQDWMERENIGTGKICNAQLLTGGTQNILIKFDRGSETYVLRMPGKYAANVSKKSITREYRLLRALEGSEIPRPRPIAESTDCDVLGEPFYLMSAVDGFNPTVSPLKSPHADSDGIRREMGFAMVDVIAKLANLDIEKVGLGSFGNPDGFLERQVARWKRQLEDYTRYDGWPGSKSLPEVEAVGAWLEQNRPGNFKKGLLHGDYHFANIMFCHDSPKIAAVVDWELATVGAPLLDLGYLVATWPEPDGTHYSRVPVTPWRGFPTAAELIQRYRDQTNQDMASVSWYSVLACYKFAIILEGTYARACAGQADADTGMRLHLAASGLMKRAETWVTVGHH